MLLLSQQCVAARGVSGGGGQMAPADWGRCWDAEWESVKKDPAAAVEWRRRQRVGVGVGTSRRQVCNGSEGRHRSRRRGLVPREGCVRGGPALGRDGVQEAVGVSETERAVGADRADALGWHRLVCAV